MNLNSLIEEQLYLDFCKGFATKYDSAAQSVLMMKKMVFLLNKKIKSLEKKTGDGKFENNLKALIVKSIITCHEYLL